MALVLALIAGPVAVWHGGVARAQANRAILPPGFTRTLVAGGLQDPDVVTFSPTGQMWVATKVGGIYSMQNGALHTVATLAVDSNAELGLTGLTFDPQYTTNGYIYVSYVTTGAFSQLSRFTVVNGVANRTSELVLVRGTQQQSQFGPGEKVQIGPDGKLWWSVGSNPYPWGNGQSLSNIYGKIIRLNLDGSVPSDDPFLNVPGVAPGVYAWGLRNPWRFTFLPDGRMMVGNTGENTWEMLDTIQAGGNYGWPFVEGNCFSCGYVNPTYAYGHVPVDGAISAVHAYAGSRFPTAYRNVVFIGDYVRGDIEAITFDPTYHTELSQTVFAGNAGTVADITEGPDGNLYYVGVFEGDVWEISATGPFAPTAVASAGPPAGPGSLTVQFSSAGSRGAYRGALGRQWDFGDGSPQSTLANPSHTYMAGGTYTATLTVDDGTSSATATTRVVAGRAPPTAAIGAPAGRATYKAGDIITFSGTATDAVDGTLPPAGYTWQVDFHSNGSAEPSYVAEAPRPFFGPVSGVTGGSFTIPDDVSQSAATFYRITLSAVNSAGVAVVATRDIRPQLSSWTIKSNPLGAGFFVDGTWHTATDTVVDVVGARHVLAGGPEQTIGGRNYRFAGWADGNALTDSFTTAAGGATYTADMEPVSAALPAGWLSTDVGTPVLTGSAEYAGGSGSFYIDGSGVDIGGNGEQFHYVDQTLNGDGTIIARVRYQTVSQPWAKAGVLIRQSTAAGAAYVAAMVTPDVSPNEPNINGVNCHPDGCDAPLPPIVPAVGHGMLMQSSNGWAGITTAVPGFTNPDKWLQLRRTGNTFATSYSTDGVTWSPIGSTTVAMSGPVAIGLFATGHQVHQLSTAAFDSVQLWAGGPPPPPPPCPAAWTCSDTGGPTLAGSASATAGTRTWTR